MVYDKCNINQIVERCPVESFESDNLPLAQVREIFETASNRLLALRWLLSLQITI